MVELLFLLLPIAAGYGWYMGRRSVRQEREVHRNRLSQRYFKGLNFLLSDQPDKAVDLFIDMLAVDSQTLETHMALGNLFRRRGEVDRAIRIHQNLVARPSIGEEDRRLAMLELGQDFMVAGLYDRAENIFDELKDDPEHSQQAQEQLLAIYQHTKDWHQAIKVAKRMGKDRPMAITRALSHFYCQLAGLALDKGNSREALKEYKKALDVDSGCTRAREGLAKLYRDGGQLEEALAVLVPVISTDPDNSSEVLPVIADLFSRLGDSEGYYNFLAKAVSQDSGVSVVLAYADLTQAQAGIGSAEALLLDELKRHPTLKGFRRLIQYQREKVAEPSAKESLNLLAELVEQQIRIRPTYRCRHCGFSANKRYWLCPSCQQWGQIKPIRGLDGD
ncbi:lipopolysaccharide assembly protein LapB [Gallaecimonas pentaromativorans]|uniref:Lipopolysaccharide assembly protein B n=1 Tax=Gallaecimonas pentaromativorans TaxID=584787 RepID=A0A3N1PS94_9GAMM|nr:lipopolysaccharide assembly protein LapB [Gallaecimonas pentaromativorans]ROQ27416.1 lipopolysaccharide biosynthesis regulator YciM [Gallaecimonas pentaromativorans]